MMKKVATITFHWAKNYGAVLQAFALQQYLKLKGYETEIINYIPLRTRVIEILLALKRRDISFFKKDINFRRFRQNELITSKKKYFSNRSLFKCQNKYDAVICGSDQIWNRAFTTRAEGKITLSYFLNFAGEKTKCISYAASFGTEDMDKEFCEVVKPELMKFDAVSVRENSAVKMLKGINIDSKMVVDPTFLLDVTGYEKLLKKCKQPYRYGITNYIINQNQTIARQVNKYVVEKYSSEFGVENAIKDCDIYEWLCRIKNSEFLVTNSFHGLAFCLIFHKPFIAVAIPGSGMNDRISTVLETVNLKERFLYEYDEAKIDDVIKTEIDWAFVDEKLRNLRELSENFLMEALK